MTVPPAFPLSPRGWSRWILAFLGQRQAEGPNLGALEMLLSYLIQLDPAPEAVPEVLAKYVTSPQASVAEAAVVLREAWLGQTGHPDTPSPSLQETLRSFGGLLDDWGALAAFMTVAGDSAQLQAFGQERVLQLGPAGRRQILGARRVLRGQLVAADPTTSDRYETRLRVVGAELDEQPVQAYELLLSRQAILIQGDAGYFQVFTSESLTPRLRAAPARRAARGTSKT
jgi:hypothetical protein